MQGATHGHTPPAPASVKTAFSSFVPHSALAGGPDGACAPPAPPCILCEGNLSREQASPSEAKALPLGCQFDEAGDFSPRCKNLVTS